MSAQGRLTGLRRSKTPENPGQPHGERNAHDIAMFPLHPAFSRPITALRFSTMAFSPCSPLRWFALALLLSFAACGGEGTVRVVRAVDGDTLVVRMETGKEERVRIIGIDTPETVDPRKPVQCYGPEASRQMHALADGKAVTLESRSGGGDRDAYGRLLRYVRLDGRDLGARMIEAGFARSYTAFPHPRAKAYNVLQASAWSARAGLWKACAKRL